MSTRAETQEMVGPRETRTSWVYWAAIVVAFGLLIADVFSDSAVWNYGVIACIVIAMAVRPGGFWGRRRDSR